MAEDVERLSRLSYLNAPSTIQDVLARDQFIDALPDDEMRLRLKQERPSTLQKALEIALELDSFQIASRQRYRVIRNVRTGEKGKVVRQAALPSVKRRVTERIHK